MLGLQYVNKAREHWEEWRPKMVAEMRREGTFNQALQEASHKAANEVAELMENGFQKFEAEEIVLPKYILLKPEEDENT